MLDAASSRTDPVIPAPDAKPHGPSAGRAKSTAKPSKRSRTRSRKARDAEAARALRPELKAGDAVIHLDHGMGRLVGLADDVAEKTDGVEPDGLERIVIAYADDVRLMVSADEMDRVWRYGGNPDAVTLDDPNSGAWAKRSAKAARDVAEAATTLLSAAEARRATAAPVIAPDDAAMAGAAKGFPHRPTRDQARAIAAVLDDMTRGYPADRLICGDVGYGKTEVAIRAAAAVASTGRQVAIVAPTTVLARQHAEVFRRRLEPLGFGVAHLSRLAKGAEAKATKVAIASGAARVVVGTHALLSKTVAFADLALLIIDEEQRFGAAHKAKLRALGETLHVVAMTATPIPATLQSAMIGLREVSLLKTAPRARRPVVTRTASWSDEAAAKALIEEHARGGQSFVVAPRLSDLEGLAERLARIAPDLAVTLVHGKLKPDDLDTAMTAFADGKGDVLLATNIIESGLNVPRANTLIVWRADMFGLGQLHQLRGRVGRSDVEGRVHLTVEDMDALPRSARDRLAALERHQSLGSGFEISALDLDQRGAGSVVGDDQAGHVTVLGANLYAHLLHLALTGHDVGTAEVLWSPELKLGLKPRLPRSYVADPAARIALYARIARVLDEGELRELRDAMEAEHGPPPPPALLLTERARLRVLCRQLNVARLNAGPKAVAADLRSGADDRAAKALAAEDETLTFEDGRLMRHVALKGQVDRLRAGRDLLKRLRKAAF